MDIHVALDSLFRNLQAGAKTVGLYPPSHPTVARFISRIGEDLESILTERDSLVVGVVDHSLVVLGIPFAGTDAMSATFATRLEERGIGSVKFRRGCRTEDVSQFIQVLGQQPDAFKRLGRLEEILPQRGIQTIRLSPQVPTEAAEEIAPPVPAVSASPMDRLEGPGILGWCLNTYRQAVGSAKRILTDARMGKFPSLAEAQTAVAGLVDGVLQDQNVMVALTMIKSYDEYLFNHSVNVCVLCIALGQALGLDSETIKEVGLGALLHDIGKVHWPESLYQKPRGLSDEEWALVQRHPLDGSEIVQKMGGVSATAREVILEHHLRYDRKGYPVVDPEKETGFFGMLAQIADAYDAITTARVYQNAFEPTRAVARLQSLSGTVFDPKLLEVFVRLVGIYPVGSLVRLNSGELALVVKANPADPSRPFVRLLFDRSGRRLAEEHEVDLMELDPGTSRFRRTIIMAVDPASKNFDVANYMIAKGEAETAASGGG